MALESFWSEPSSDFALSEGVLDGSVELSVSDFGSAHWFGGPEELVQRFPISKTATRQRIPYLPGDMLQVTYDRP